jgi:asparagine synthase (glutamine-hydrolysing)
VCGITGVFGISDKDQITKMVDKLKNRGPDNKGIAITDFAMIANARLSIIDVEGGNQPIWNNEGTHVVVANCEIYNFRELREDLVKQGFQFNTNSDTEVILQAYLAYGSEFVKYLEGIFALAILDLPKKCLVLARDRLGVKPLYYSNYNNSIYFASEIKGILAIDEIPRILSKQNLFKFLQLGYNFGIDSLFEGIFQLLPAQVLEIQLQNGITHISNKFYWEGSNNPKEFLDLKRLHYSFQKAIESQLISERPLGVYLSGGLDSSMVTAYTSQFIDEIKTFTQSFGEVDETPYARLISEQFETNHHEITHDPNDEINMIDELLYAMEHPTYGISPTYKLAKFAREKGCVVMLSGLGNDELFGGYVKHQRALKLNKIMNLDILANPTSKLLLKIGQTNYARYIMSMGSTSTKLKGLFLPYSHDYLSKLFNKKMIKVNWNEEFSYYSTANNFFEKVESVLINNQLEGNYLKIADRMSMAASVEVRVPFLTTALVEYGLKLPISAKINNGVSKFAPRKISKEFLKLPEPNLVRGENSANKGGYGYSSLDFWNRGLKEFVYGELDPKKVKEFKVFDSSFVLTYLNKVKQFADVRLLWNMANLHRMIEIFDMSLD